MKKLLRILVLFFGSSILTAQDLAVLGDRNVGFYQSATIEVQNVYPNPATDIAIINYSISDPSSEAKIVLHDLLGTKTLDYPLKPFEKTLKIDLLDMKEGVYFYTLYTGGKSKITKKLIIKK